MTEHRIAGAPISWGACEVPGWGYQLRPDEVLAEMREVGPARHRARARRVPARRGEGPVADVRTSADNLRAVLRSTR